MRGNYYDGKDSTESPYATATRKTARENTPQLDAESKALTLFKQQSRPTLVPPPETYNNRTTIENGNPCGPTIVPSPDAPSSPEDLRAIVAYVAFQVLRSEADWSLSDLRESHPALNGITDDQLDAVITEALA
jgi:hypothetical protein